ncbi:GntR family transcriptional regulator [Sulfidibacter corallicola]|uniref:GntR family transcriptional regulator n=1 Tax=Sulfidibacter corallicola TaxID=2818388 RepID=A0A8A4TLW2_SULCO|nr:GntR family transcriptional regulator [Sulfidibacter corallicola]QTD49868.1 GntR family transcriptional regulator [Sulfidibacter corallicola]
MLLSLSQQSQESLHQQLSRQIRRLILAGDLPPGFGLDSIRALAKTHRVSAITVRRAYDDLEHEGLIYSRPGKGYYVAEVPAHRKSDLIFQRLSHLLPPILGQALEEGLTEDELLAFIKNQIKTLGGA